MKTMVQKAGIQNDRFLDIYDENSKFCKCYKLSLTCLLLSDFKLFFTLFIAPFVQFVYQMLHKNISAPMK